MTADLRSIAYQVVATIHMDDAGQPAYITLAPIDGDMLEHVETADGRTYSTGASDSLVDAPDDVVLALPHDVNEWTARERPEAPGTFEALPISWSDS